MPERDAENHQRADDAGRGGRRLHVIGPGDRQLVVRNGRGNRGGCFFAGQNVELLSDKLEAIGLIIGKRCEEDGDSQGDSQTTQERLAPVPGPAGLPGSDIRDFEEIWPAQQEEIARLPP